MPVPNLKYTVLYNNIHIEDSYKETDPYQMELFLIGLKEIYSKDKCFILYSRSINSLITEWKAHNVLYNLHLFRSHTKDVDLNDEPWYRKLIYKMLAVFY